MENFIQPNHSSETQINIGEFNLISKTGTNIVGRVIKTNHTNNLAGILGSAVEVEIEMENRHLIRYTRNEGLINKICEFYVDGEQLLRKESFNPFESIFFKFKIENIDCEFSRKLSPFLLFNIKIKIGGNEIFSTIELT
jgi:hypothetical protein